MSEFVLVFLSRVLRMPVGFGAYPFPLYLAVVFCSFLLGALLKKKNGQWLMAGTALGTILFMILFYILAILAIAGGD